ncbi:Z1 domain-containing protein [Thiohalophilus sp.]|uniref:Z1 domain-containing protein n=1 Tax=Thiohalophilus sp. TaxID=3028392 RepID=UPI002ACE77F2|nr:Z1 domain-containing protein [Thiohalophilus sp.]MDZ7803619.1 Z1 domain-containing protein [Thiohalophilus sp.]
MSSDLQSIRDMVGAVLARSLPTPEMIRERIEHVRTLYPAVTDEQAELLAKEFENVHGVTMDIGAMLEEPGFEKWLDSAKSEITFYFWDRYYRLLGERNFSGQVLATIDSITDRILGLLENPKKSGKWDRRGMVVGHVQSGKTANYTGLITKAADAGYEVIIVIAGIHNNLRSQTQSRIDEGFIGYDSSKLQMNRHGVESIIGVGRYDSRRRPNAFTNTLRDFNKQTATSIGIPLENLKQPAVFVIKKNTSTLKNLLEWLREHNAKRGASSISAPMLLIDDEADNASINIKKGNDEVSRINGQIRQLLDLFDRSCYVGYTATPFANIFIDPDSEDEMFGADLFPRDFIVSLDPPGNYFGPSRVFLPDTDETEEATVVRHIEDNGDILPLKHKKTHVVTNIPKSLDKAIRTFIVGRAIRLVRGHTTAHNSMLVNASRFTDVQRQLRNEIHNRINEISSSVRVNGSNSENSALRDPEIATLKQLFDEEYRNTGVIWANVQSKLWESISRISVVEVNSRSSDSLDYVSHDKNGLNVIAVGGFSLSRGLTLEGLMVSYFLRNSMMYDTLMQMGRWFGYRPGYDDLCRVWMPEEAEGWYEHIAESIEELRDELRRMEAANATPKEFGLKVRSHPDTLIVTARNKMGSGERLVVSVGLANEFVETAVLRRDRESINANHQSAKNLAMRLRSDNAAPENGERVRGGQLVRRIPASYVLEFIAEFRNHQGSFLTETDPILKYIMDRSETELSEWDIYFPGLQQGTEKSLVDKSLGFTVVCQRRGAGKRSDENTLLITEKQRVSSRGIESIGLSDSEIAKARNDYLEEKKFELSPDRVNYPDRIYRYVRKRPLLIVHLLAIGSNDADLSNSEPVVAWSISFPHTEHEEKRVEYVVNTTWFRERYQEEGDEEEAEGDED